MRPKPPPPSLLPFSADLEQGTTTTISIFPESGFFYAAGLRTYSGPGCLDMSVLLNVRVAIPWTDAACFNPLALLSGPDLDAAIELADEILRTTPDDQSETRLRVQEWRARLEQLRVHDPEQAWKKDGEEAGDVAVAHLPVDIGCITCVHGLEIHARPVRHSCRLVGYLIGEAREPVLPRHRRVR